MPVDKNKKIEKILNTPTLNLLPSVNLKTDDKVRDRITNRTSIHLGPGTIHIENFDANKDYFKLRVLKMLDLLILLVGKKNQYRLSEEEAVNCLVEFSIKQYAELMGKNNLKSTSTKKNVRRIIEEALSLLNDLSISTAEKRKSEIKEFKDMKLIEEFKCRKKKIHKVISVEALLNVCPKIPAIEEVRLKKGGWRSRIEESLTNSLDKLADDKILVCWEYCNPNCEPLSKKQIKMDSFFDFQKYRVHFKVSGI